LIEGTREKTWMALLVNVKAPCVGIFVAEGFSGKCSACCQESTRILKNTFTAKWTPPLRATQKLFVPTQVGVGINQVQLMKRGRFRGTKRNEFC
jgi:hypothetical protein